MLRSISIESAESVESVLKKKKKATVGRICRKGFKPGIKEVMDDYLICLVFDAAYSVILLA